MKTRRVAVRGIIFKDGKLLVAKFKQSDGGESQHWGTFGGGLDLGESIAAGIHREMIEETGIAPKVGKLLFIQQFAHEEKEHLEFFFHIENPEDYAAIDFETTTHGHIELTRQEFVDPSTEPVLPAFLRTVDIADYIAGNQPVLIWNEYEKFS